jgi:hypothetical protein
MKKSLLLSCIATLCLSASVFAQTIRRCNNNPGITGVNVYTTLQAAHDASVANDIIYVEPSTTSYGALDCRKRLTIIGNGYYLNANANNSFDTRSSLVGAIIFNNGSANSILTGVEAYPNTVNINDINVTITRCITAGTNFGVSTNLVGGLNSRGNNGTITKCILRGSVAGSNSTIVASQYGYNCLISNCIIYGSSINNLTNSVVTNNIYYRGSGSSFNALFGCSVTNNILDARGSATVQEFVSGVISGGSVGNTISNNICLAQAATPSGNGNVNFGDETLTFLVSNPWNFFTVNDANFQLASGSPAIGIGSGGTNAGVFGGSNPYILSGMPAYPVITTYLPSGVGNVSTPLQVNVTVRGNN